MCLNRCSSAASSADWLPFFSSRPSRCESLRPSTRLPCGCPRHRGRARPPPVARRRVKDEGKPWSENLPYVETIRDSVKRYSTRSHGKRGHGRAVRGDCALASYFPAGRAIPRCAAHRRWRCRRRCASAGRAAAGDQHESDEDLDHGVSRWVAGRGPACWRRRRRPGLVVGVGDSLAAPPCVELTWSVRRAGCCRLPARRRPGRKAVRRLRHRAGGARGRGARWRPGTEGRHPRGAGVRPQAASSWRSTKGRMPPWL